MREKLHLLFLKAWVASTKILGKFLPTMSDEKTEAALRDGRKRPLEELIEAQRNKAQKDRK